MAVFAIAIYRVSWQSVGSNVPNARSNEHHRYLMFHLKGELRAMKQFHPL